jgi:hypothetical protein
MTQATATPQQFVGTWQLVSVRAMLGDGSPTELYGPGPLGYITYTPDSAMHAIVMEPDLPNATPVEVPGRAIAYAATWEVRGPEVVHHVTASLPPDWIGTDLVRTYAFHGDRMTLTAQYRGDRYVALVWQRAQPVTPPGDARPMA